MRPLPLPLVVPLVVLVTASGLAAQESRLEASLHGLVLVNAFANSAGVNNSDVPQFVLPLTAAGARTSAAGGTVRQSRVTVTATKEEVAGGRLAAELDVDFFGGQQPSTGGRTFPLARIRRAFAELTWGRLALFVGQESPPIASVSPSSLASVGFPGFAGAGNLWLWIPQVRVSGDLAPTGPVRLGLELAALAPTSGDAQTAFFTQPDIAEQTGRPYLQGRVRARWGDGDDLAEVSIGGHLGWLALGGDRRVESRALAVSAWVPLVRGVELRAEAFTGQAIAGLGGGGIGQNFGLDSAAVHTTGGWAQLNARPAAAWEIGVGAGIDDPDDDDLDPATQRLRNLALEAHAGWRRAPLALGVEVRRLETRYGPAGGEPDATHFNLAAGIEF
jgi:hypothetical protein